MKTVLVGVIAFVASGCLGAWIPAEPAPRDGGTTDMAQATGTGGNGNGTGSGGGGGMASTDMATTSPADLAGVTPTGTKAFGTTCTTDGPAGDCMSGMCKQFVQGTIHRCTKSCTAATQAADCPAPSDGTCTPNLYCKFIQ